MSIISISATLEDAQTKFSFYRYDGRTKIPVVGRKHQRELANGDTFGVREIKGGRYYLIFPGMQHVDFTMESDVIDRILKKSEPVKTPEMQEIKGAGGRIKKVFNEAVVQNRENLRGRMSARYRKIVRNEMQTGIDLSHYQWRVVPTNNFRIKTTKRVIVLREGDLVGIRFISESQGGVLVRADGFRALIATEEYDALVQKAELMMPITKWPTDFIPIKRIQEDRSAAEAQAIAEQKEAKRLRREAKQEAVRRQKEEARAKRAEEKRKNEEFLENAAKVAAVFNAPRPKRTKEEADAAVRDAYRGNVKAPKFNVEDLDVDLDADDVAAAHTADVAQAKTTKPKVNLVELAEKALAARNKRKEAQAEEDEDSEEAQLDSTDQGPGDVDDLANIKSIDLDALDDDEEELPELDDDDDDVPVETPKRGKKEPEDAKDDEDDDIDLDVDVDGTELPEYDVMDDEDEDEEEEDDAEPQDSDDFDPDAAAADEDEDAAKAEKLKAKKHRETKIDVGSIVSFKRDTSKKKRKFVVVSIEPAKANDNVLIYKVYDVTNSPDVYHTVRIVKGKLFDDLVDDVDQMPHKEFVKVFEEVQNLDKSNERLTA